MKQFKIAILLIIACITLCACPKQEEGNRFIKFINKSEHRIACQMVWSGSITKVDTLYRCDYTSDRIILKDSIHFYECPVRDNGWEDSFNVIPFLQFLIMDGDIYEQHYKEPCDTVRKYVPILHCYQLTLADLQRMNWTVVFPPEE